MNANIQTATADATERDNFDFLPQELKDKLAAQGIVKPTQIQARSIPLSLEGRDILAQSHTGSGKTLAFGLSIAMRLREGQRGKLRALVLTPTRELAGQVSEVLESTLSALHMRVLAITGGASYQRQKRMLHDGVDVVVGTPGRVCDLLSQDSLRLGDLQMFVLDEVDQMLDIGFAEELRQIRERLSEEVQTLFFSATLSPDIRSMARSLLRNPLELLAERKQMQSPSTIRHGYLEVKTGSEQKALINTLLFHKPEQALIFCKTRQECGDLSEALSKRGFNAAALHGDLTQQERNATMEKFKAKRLQYLIATNVAARGIDVHELPLVVNFNVPSDVESYTHRVGRTGRNGAEGQAWTLVTPATTRNFEFIMRRNKLKPEMIAVPSCAEILHRALENQIQELQKERDESQNRTIGKAVTRALAKLEPEAKEAVLQEMMIRSLERLETYYTDEIVCARKIVRLDDAPRERPFRKPSDNRGSFEHRRSSPGGFKDRRNSGSAPRSRREDNGFSFEKRPGFGDRRAAADHPFRSRSEGRSERPAFGAKKTFSPR